MYYEIREEAVADAIRVEALIFSEPQGRAPSPLRPMPRSYWLSPYSEYVHAPNALMRWLGDTWEKRLDRARRRVIARAERQRLRELDAATHVRITPLVPPPPPPPASAQPFREVRI
jgi:hypothetical protein